VPAQTIVNRGRGKARYGVAEQANIVQQVDLVARKLFGENVRVQHKITTFVDEVIELSPDEFPTINMSPKDDGTNGAFIDALEYED